MRATAGAESSAPLRSSSPVGLPGSDAKKSPFTPTTVDEASASFSRSVSFSVATIAPFESAGVSV